MFRVYATTPRCVCCVFGVKYVFRNYFNNIRSQEGRLLFGGAPVSSYIPSKTSKTMLEFSGAGRERVCKEIRSSAFRSLYIQPSIPTPPLHNQTQRKLKDIRTQIVCRRSTYAQVICGEQLKCRSIRFHRNYDKTWLEFIPAPQQRHTHTHTHPRHHHHHHHRRTITGHCKIHEMRFNGGLQRQCTRFTNKYTRKDKRREREREREDSFLL